MNSTEEWEKFTKSGKIEDYLKYKKHWDEEYADDGQRTDNKRTDGGRE